MTLMWDELRTLAKYFDWDIDSEQIHEIKETIIKVQDHERAKKAEPRLCVKCDEPVVSEAESELNKVVCSKGHITTTEDKAGSMCGVMNCKEKTNSN